MRRTTLLISLLQVATFLNTNTVNAWNADGHTKITRHCATKFCNRLNVDDIVAACVGVDTAEDTNPLTNFDEDAQMWHFNINSCYGGTLRDSRFQLAKKYLDMAISATECLDMAISNTNNAEYYLGRGLHAIQDVFAHTDNFVSKFKFYDGKEFYGHLFMKKSNIEQHYYGYDIDKDASEYADDPSFICEEYYMSCRSKVSNGCSQRYSDAITASLIYLQVYFMIIDPDGYLNNNMTEDINKRLFLSTDGLNAKAIQLRGTFAIYCLSKVLYDIFVKLTVSNKNFSTYRGIAYSFFETIELPFIIRKIDNVKFDYKPPCRYPPVPIYHNEYTAKILGHIEQKTGIFSAIW